MFEKIGDGFRIDPVVFDISTLAALPVVTRIYGGARFEIPNQLCWETYAGLNNGEISFTRNTSQFLPEAVEHILVYMRKLVKFEPRPERVHFLRTRGVIIPHKDESSRNCCINLGVQNSSSAVTKVSKHNTLEGYRAHHESFICQDGSAYLLDTSRVHSVEGDFNIPRLMVTYGFSQDFQTIKSALK